MSDPKLKGTKPAATAAAEPPEDPPGTAVWSKGFNVFLKYEVSVEPPIANSSMFNLPINTAFSSCSLFITVDS